MNRICKSLISGSGPTSLLNKLTVIKNFTTHVKLVSATSSLLLNQNKLVLSNQVYRKFYSTEAVLNFDDDEDRPRFQKRDDRSPRSGGFGASRDLSGSRLRPQRKGGRSGETASTLEDFANSEQVESTGEVLSHAASGQVKFSDYNIPPALLDRLSELGYDAPFQIQKETLEYTLAGKDLVGKAFTGSGKTLAFAIPIITRLLNNPRQSPYPKCLVLSPTRELCIQLTKTISQLAPNLNCVAVYGGAGMSEQMAALRRRTDVVCATPGRLRDLIQRDIFKTDDIELICLDEADELLTNNFLEQIKDVIEISNKKQMLMFSATINKNVLGVVRRYMQDPVTIDLTEGQKFKLPTNIEHFILEGRTPRNTHAKLIAHYLKKFKSERCIAFINRKVDANVVSGELQRIGIRATDFHSDIGQEKRQKLLAQFREGRLKVLVATDVAARGIDIPEINLIVHLGSPMTMDSYIHRSGRAGRAGRPGVSILVDDGSIQSETVLRDLQRVIKFKPSEKVDLDAMRSERGGYDGGAMRGGYNSAPSRRFNNDGPSRFGYSRQQPPSRRNTDLNYGDDDLKPRYESRAPIRNSSSFGGRPQQRSSRFDDDDDDDDEEISYRR